MTRMMSAFPWASALATLEVAFQGDTAFARPEVYEALEERGVKYAIRIPANDSLERDIAELLPPPVETESEAFGGVQGVLVPSCQLEDGPTGRGGAILQQARHLRAVDERRQAGSEDDALKLSPVPIERSAAMAERDRLQPGEPVAAAGAAEENRQVVAHQLATAAGEDRRPNTPAITGCYWPKAT
jgi:hypothetical protein